MTNITKTNITSNAIVKSNATTREFIGKAWINTIKQGKFEGTQFINMTLDNNITSVSLTKEYKVQLWPNKKRDGHPTDADYRVSLVSPLITA